MITPQWLAGFFDGEGHVGIYGKDKSYRIDQVKFALEVHNSLIRPKRYARVSDEEVQLRLAAKHQLAALKPYSKLTQAIN